jgi:hypothetical protein
MIFKILLFIVFVWLLLVIVGYAAAALTGRVKRAYATLPTNAVIKISGAEKGLNDWAQEYKPVMMLRSNLPTPPLLTVLYEGIDQPDSLVLVYYHVWEDEVHPDPVYHRLYWLFRAAFYGYPVRDIEYFQITVDKQTGEVTQVLFETTPGTDYFPRLSKHILARYHRTETGYSLTLSERDGGVISDQQNAEVQFQGHHIVVGVATWNHLTQAVKPGDVDFDVVAKAPLGILTDEAYRNGKYVRKSQGDFKTSLPLLDKWFGLLAMGIVMGPVWLFYLTFFPNRREK